MNNKKVIRGFFDANKTVEQEAYDLLLRESTLSLFERSYGKIQKTSCNSAGIVHYHAGNQQITTEVKVDNDLHIQV